MLSFIRFFKESFAKFWISHPALLYGLSFLIAFVAVLEKNWFVLVPLITFISIGRYRLILALLIAFSAILAAKIQYQFPKIDSEGIQGIAQVKFSSIALKKKSFGNVWQYQGVITDFIPDGEKESIAHGLPVYISLFNKKVNSRPNADGSYWISGILCENNRQSYSLINCNQHPWQLIEKTYGLAESRYFAKNWVKKYIRHKISHANSREFLSGIATGQFDDKQLSFEFNRFGLQHIMAISGFHFAILAAILSHLLGLVLSRRFASLTLIFCLSTYFLFLGPSPSVMRSWISIVIVLCGHLLEKTSSGLNSLGIALLAILISDPLLAFHLGFQFSFCTTAAILLLYPLCDYYMQWIFPKRSLGQALKMNLLDQHGYCVLAMIRQALALTFAVNFVAVPLSLAYFHKVSLIGFIYNLFFPFLVSISMLLLIMGILFDLIFSPIGALFHAVNSAYTKLILDFTFNMPMSIDYAWRASSISLEVIILYLTTLFIAGVVMRYRLDLKRTTLQDLLFV